MERERFELHKVLVGEISKGMEQVKQVKASLSSNDQDRLLETMLASYRDALSILTGSTPDEQSRSVITSSLDPPGSARMKRKRRPMLEVIVRSPGDDDGYSWRQYGQKHVLPSKNIREYYKCGRKGCPGRKHVEKLDDDSSTVVVTYRGRHTCLKTVTEPKLVASKRKKEKPKLVASKREEEKPELSTTGETKKEKPKLVASKREEEKPELSTTGETKKEKPKLVASKRKKEKPKLVASKREEEKPELSTTG